MTSKCPKRVARKTPVLTLELDILFPLIFNHTSITSPQESDSFLCQNRSQGEVSACNRDGFPRCLLQSTFFHLSQLQSRIQASKALHHLLQLVISKSRPNASKPFTKFLLAQSPTQQTEWESLKQAIPITRKTSICSSRTCIQRFRRKRHPRNSL